MPAGDTARSRAGDRAAGTNRVSAMGWAGCARLPRKRQAGARVLTGQMTMVLSVKPRAARACFVS